MNVRVAISGQLVREYLYTLNALGRHHGHFYELSSDRPHFTIGPTGLRVSPEFGRRYEAGIRAHAQYFRDEPLVRNSDGTIDYLSTAFYLLSGAQEWEGADQRPVSVDSHGRFPFNASVQRRFDFVSDDVVSGYYSNILERIGIDGLSPNPPKASRVFLSHDIDSLRSSTYTQARFAIKRRDPGALVRMLFSALLRRNDKADLDRIMRWEEAADLRATYFWLTEQHAENDVPHADYDVGATGARTLIEDAAGRGHAIGLHKSATGASVEEELDKLPSTVISNRFHFLKYRLPASFDALEGAGVQLDASAGFAEAPGFRHSYGLPFQPYHHVERRPYEFVEVPLTIMDTTFLYYRRESAGTAWRSIVDLLERHRTDRVIGILFHNEYLAPGVFTPWVKLYRDLLLYLRDNGWSGLAPREIVAAYGPRESTGGLLDDQ